MTYFDVFKIFRDKNETEKLIGLENLKYIKLWKNHESVGN